MWHPSFGLLPPLVLGGPLLMPLFRPPGPLPLGLLGGPLQLQLRLLSATPGSLKSRTSGLSELSSPQE